MQNQILSNTVIIFAYFPRKENTHVQEPTNIMTNTSSGVRPSSSCACLINTDLFEISACRSYIDDIELQERQKYMSATKCFPYGDRAFSGLWRIDHDFVISRHNFAFANRSHLVYFPQWPFHLYKYLCWSGQRSSSIQHNPCINYLYTTFTPAPAPKPAPKSGVGLESGLQPEGGRLQSLFFKDRFWFYFWNTF